MEITHRAYQVGKCIIDPLENKMSCNGHETVLQPKFIELLNCLVNRHPDALTREELIEIVWEGNHFVGEKALTNAIWHLRKSFKELDPEQVYIETLRKTGYRLTQDPIRLYSEEQLQSPVKDKKWPVIFFVGLLIIISMLSVGLLLWHFSGQHSQQQQYSTFVLPINSIESVTASPGREIYPAVSNDLRYLVYSWRQLGKPANLYLRDLQNPEYPVKQLTDTSNAEGRSVFSPDGKTLYYYRYRHDDFCEIVKLSLVNATSVVLTQCSDEFYTDLDISTDGDTLVYIAEKMTATGARISQIKLLDLQSNQLKETVVPCLNSCEVIDETVSFSPDALQVAVTRTVENNQKALFLVDIESGKTQRLTPNYADIRGVDWHPKKNQLVFSAIESGKRYGYFLDIDTGKITNTQIAGMSSPNFSSDGSVYFHQWDLDKVITRLKLDEQVTSSPFSMLSTNFSSKYPAYNAAQRKLVYVSDESGSPQLWIVNSDSSARKQLTNLTHTVGEVLDPSWSENGRYILFSIADKGRSSLFYFDFKSEKTHPISIPFVYERKPRWSIDNQTVLVSDGEHVYRYDLNGQNLGKAVNLPAKYAVEMPAGDIIFSADSGRLWIKHHYTGREELLVDKVRLARYYTWLFVPQSEQRNARIYYFKVHLGDYRISYYDLVTKQHHDFIALPERAYSRSSGMTFIPEQEWLVYTGYLSPEIEIKRLPAKYVPK